MTYQNSILLLCLVMTATGVIPLSAAHAATRNNCRNVVVDKIWSGSKAGAAAISTPDAIFLAYYNDARYMTLAKVNLANCSVEKKILSSQYGGYDLHNYIAIAFDSRNILHIAGNMHNVPLVYFQASKAFDISTVKPSAMTGRFENRTTYPSFFMTESTLNFMYRDGGSGNGLTYINTLTDNSATLLCRGPRGRLSQNASAAIPTSFLNRYWIKSTPTAVFSNRASIDGVQVSVSAYPTRPVLGPDKFYHFANAWRISADAATNFAVTYVKTRDFKNWSDASGRIVQVPVSANDQAAFAVNTGVDKGLVNTIRVAFTASGNPVVLFTKYLDTPEGKRNGVFATRFDGLNWNEVLIGVSQKLVEVKGFGSLSSLPDFSGLNLYGPVATMTYEFSGEQRRYVNLDSETLLPTNLRPAIPPVQSVTPSPVPPLAGLENDLGVVLHSVGYINYGGPLISLRRRHLPDNNDRPFTCPPRPAAYCNPPPSDFVLDTRWPE